MSGDAYSRMSTDALISEFIRLAKIVRHFWTVLPDIPERSPERLVLKKELRAISAELRARGPIEKLRPLFDHESDDVRGFAAGQFMSIDEEWAHATVGALIEGLSTKDVVMLRARARGGPPDGPALKDMTAEQLVARFEDGGMRRYATRFMGGESEPWDVELCNRTTVEMGDVARELTSRDALAALLTLLDHPSIAVRGMAACCCLSMAPERAVPVLEAIKVEDDLMDKDSASWALDRWRQSSDKP
jgi:hypothetical protein